MHLIGILLLKLIDIYTWILIASVIFSWLIAFNVINTGNRIVYTIGDFLARVTEPVLGRIRRFLPSLGPVDISPIVLLIVLWFAQVVIADIFF